MSTPSRQSTVTLLVAMVSFALWATSCSSTSQAPVVSDPEDRLITGNDVQISGSTRILDPTAREGLIGVSEDLSRLTFLKGSGVTFQPGDVLVSEPTRLAPYGLLRKVGSVRAVGRTLEVETVEASLEDAVQNGDLLQTEELDLQDIEEQSPDIDGVTTVINPENRGLIGPQSTKTIGTLELKMKEVVLCEGDGGKKITLNGSFKADFKVFANAKIRWAKIKHFDAGIEMNEYAEIRLSGECAKNLFNKEKELKRIKLRTRTYWLGPVPVVVTPEMVITAGASGQVSAKVDFQATHDFHARYGVAWNRGEGWDWINERSQAFGYKSPQFSVSLNARAYVGAKAGLRFYGVGYVYVYPKVFADFDAQVKFPQGQYNWKLEAGFSVGLGAKASVFGYTLGEINKDLVEWKKVLAQDSGQL
ncbi:MAG: hypothetical protein U0Z75_07965 [Deinococcaceae bacterium]